MSDVTIFHNNACSTSRHVLAAADQPDIVRYLDQPLNVGQLLELIGKLEDPPADLVRKDAHFKELGLAAEDYESPQAVADLLAAHPRLMQRPVVVRGERAIIGRPKERAEAFLAK